MSRWLTIAALGAGVLLLAALVATVGLGSVVRSAEALGWGGFLLFGLCGFAVVAVLGLAWATVAPGGGPVPLFLWGRLVREAVADVLPFSQVGGILAGARAVVAGGAPADLAFAATIVDILTEILAQIFYTLIGLSVLAGRLGGVADAPAVLWAALAGLVALFAAAALVFGGQGVAVRGLGRVVSRWAPQSEGAADTVAGLAEAILRRRLRLSLAVALHVAGWVGASAGSWLVLRLIGLQLSLLDVIAVESLMFAVRSVAFALPGGLGLQEAAYVLIGPIFGLDAASALALSLLKRGRDFAFGVPVILAWQIVEGRLLLRRGRRISSAAGPPA